MAPVAARTSRSSRDGVTLLELVIVITVLSVIGGVTALLLPQTIIPPDDTPHRITDARTMALRTGVPVHVVVHVRSGFLPATALPDGTVLVDSAAHVDRLTGRITVPRDSTRREPTP